MKTFQLKALCIVYLCALSIGLSAQKLTVNAAPYTISIIQGTDTLNVAETEKTEIHLKRAEFKFLFELQTHNYVFFIASKSAEYYNTKANRSFPTCLMFCGGAVGADVMFNPDKDICVYGFAQGISCWYYDSATEHRFDGNAENSENGKVVTRTINKLYDYQTQKNTSLKKLKPGTVLYMVFSDIDHEPCDECESHADVTAWRRYLKITFD